MDPIDFEDLRATLTEGDRLRAEHTLAEIERVSAANRQTLARVRFWAKANWLVLILAGVFTAANIVILIYK